jgi:hypothetical protein
MNKEGKSQKGAVITVAIIGAIATLGAAILSNSDKAKEQPPSIQQSSSGTGAVNVGRDAVITNNIKSAAEEAAVRVQACEERHDMKTAYEKTDSHEIIPATSTEDAQYISHIDFRSCTWPKSRYSDEDGYLEIRVRTVKGPGEYEATGMTDADRITAPCSQLIVAYQLGHMGEYENDTAFTINADTVVVRETRELWKNDGSLSFYPNTGEFVVLHNGHYGLQSAKCA